MRCIYPDKLCIEPCSNCADGFPELHAMLMRESCIDWFKLANKYPDLRDKYIEYMKEMIG